jgi:Family of unknown function (DUF5675)
MYLVLKRISDNGVQTVGQLELKNAWGHTLLRFDTLELSYQNNQKRISCLKPGKYIVRKKTSFRFGKVFELLFTPGRTNILIHQGNFNSQTKGCILIGNGLIDINRDFQVDVLNSRSSMKNLLATLVEQTTIEIYNAWDDLTVK